MACVNGARIDVAGVVMALLLDPLSSSSLGRLVAEVVVVASMGLVEGRDMAGQRAPTGLVMWRRRGWRLFDVASTCGLWGRRCRGCGWSGRRSVVNVPGVDRVVTSTRRQEGWTVVGQWGWRRQGRRINATSRGVDGCRSTGLASTGSSRQRDVERGGQLTVYGAGVDRVVAST